MTNVFLLEAVIRSEKENYKKDVKTSQAYEDFLTPTDKPITVVSNEKCPDPGKLIIPRCCHVSAYLPSYS